LKEKRFARRVCQDLDGSEVSYQVTDFFKKTNYVNIIKVNNVNKNKKRLRGPMDKALVYGTRDSGFDPQRSRCFFLLRKLFLFFLIVVCFFFYLPNSEFSLLFFPSLRVHMEEKKNLWRS
jgi:hypothetical protein